MRKFVHWRQLRDAPPKALRSSVLSKGTLWWRKCHWRFVLHEREETGRGARGPAAPPRVGLGGLESRCKSLVVALLDALQSFSASPLDSPSYFSWSKIFSSTSATGDAGSYPFLLPQRVSGDPPTHEMSQARGLAEPAQPPAAEGRSPQSAGFIGETLTIDSAPSPHDDDETRTISSTASLAPSVTSFRMEYGRRYHAFNEDAYWLPNDEEEMSRLELQHVVWLLSLNGRLHLAPLPAEMERVCELGTGTGKWAIEFADAHPTVHVTGTDLSPIQPELVPPNCTFLVDNIEDDWVYREPFDYIHGRMLMLGGSRQPRQASMLGLP